MKRTMFYTMFLTDDKQKLAFEADGNAYRLSLSISGKYDFDSNSQVTCREMVHSGMTLNFDEAMRVYCHFVREFGDGSYSWEDRCKLVCEQFNA